MIPDAVTAAPQLYKTVLDNDRVRVVAMRGMPGTKTALHSHPSQVAIAMSDGAFRFTSPDGQSFEVSLQTGQVMFLDPTEHTTEVIGKGEASVLLVELKR